MKRNKIIKRISTSAICILLSHVGFSNTLISRDSIGVENQNGKKVILHKLESKESYYSLARKYHLTPKAIIDFNANKSLKAGDVIKIPTNQPFESVKSISAARSSNGESTNNAAENGGTTLSAQETEFIEYKVGAKETLFAISKRFGTSVDAIKKANNLTNNSLKAGQTIKIPNTAVEASVTKPSKETNVISDEELHTASKKIEELAPDKEENTEAKSPKEDSTPANRYGIKQVTASGIGVWMEDLNGESGKMLALHNSAPVGTVIKITNPMTNRTTYAKVVGKFNETSDNKDAIIVISKSVASLIGVIDRRFRVNISY